MADEAQNKDAAKDAAKAADAPAAEKAPETKSENSGSGRNERNDRGGDRGGRGGRGGDRGGRGGQRRGRREEQQEQDGPEYIEKVVFINRCAKVVKGGRRFSFSALVVSGDGEGKVGVGFGKANEVVECIRKGSEGARRDFRDVNLEGSTIPHQVVGVFGGSKVLLRPASTGTGLIAGGGVRAVLEAAGVKDVLSKSLGSDNPSNVVKATLDGLLQLRNKRDIYRVRGKKFEESKKSEKAVAAS